MQTNFLTLLEASLAEKAPSGLSDASGRRVKLGDTVKVRGTGKRYTVSTVGSNYAKAQGNGEEIDLTSTFFYVVSENEEIPNEMRRINEISYEKDLTDDKPRVVSGVYGMQSKSFTKKFKNQAAQDRFFDDERNAGNYEVYQVKIDESVEEIPNDMEFLTEPETCEEEFYTIQNFRSQADIHEAIVNSLSDMMKESKIDGFVRSGWNSPDRSITPAAAKSMSDKMKLSFSINDIVKVVGRLGMVKDIKTAKDDKGNPYYQVWVKFKSGSTSMEAPSQVKLVQKWEGE